MKAIRIGNVRIVPIFTFEDDGVPVYRIEEIVDPDGHYIVWDGIFKNLKNAIMEVIMELGLDKN